MISMRSIAISIFWAALSAAPLICAQDVKPSEARLIIQPPAFIQELPLQPRRAYGLSLRADPVMAPSIDAQDLSRYRDFQFGMDLPAIAKLADAKPSEAKVIHQRPALIQELEWHPQLSLTSSQADPVRAIFFSFYNGELFRVVVNYDRYKTEGLTTEDIVEAMSARYGTATRPAAEITFSSSQVYNDSEVVIARWEDSQYSFNLYRSSYQPTFGMVGFSKRLDALARAAVAEAIRLDEQDAPQREIARQTEQDEKDRAEEGKARLANKPNFRP
ncbi:MAG: hypothetical protein LAO07_14470 [Acidobacteriia bacterium]|nr:hypothetical protein [Terriglobia bacterium]